MTPARALLREAEAARVSIHLDGDALKARGNPNPDLLARLRAAKPDLVALLRGEICRH
jgi:hypothetical protein